MPPRYRVLAVKIPFFYTAYAQRRAGIPPTVPLAVLHHQRVVELSPAALLALSGGEASSLGWGFAGDGDMLGLSCRALRHRVPELRFIPYDEAFYAGAATPIYEVCAAFSPLVAPLAPHLILVDLTGAGPEPERAGQLLEAIRATCGLQPAGGLAGNCWLARSAAAMAARRVAAAAIGFIPAGPSSLEVVPPGQETAFAASLPLHFLAESGLYDPLGIGGRLAAMGIRHLGELTAVPKDALLAWFGAAAGTRLHELARGWDPTPVKPLYPPDRISLLHRPDPAQPGYTGSAEMEEVLAGLCTSLAGILADRGLGLRRLSLNLVFRHCSRQESLVLPHPVSERMVLTAACRRLWQRLKPQEEVLEIVLQGWDLAPRKATQLDLYRPIPSQPAAAPGLEAALYPLRARFGPSVLRTAAELPLTRRERVREMWERECL